MADFFAAKCSALMALSKHSTCSSSESRKALSRDKTVDITEAMACSDAFSAAPANHRALCASGSLSIKSVNQFLPRTPEGANSSCTNLNTDTMCRRSVVWLLSGGMNSASRSTTEVSKPSAAS